MKQVRLVSLLSVFLIFPSFSGLNSPEWGFFAHRKINYLAVFTLHPDLMVFYKSNLSFITEEAVTPDRRRYATEGEAPRHYIDLDLYGDSALFDLPRNWDSLILLYPEDTLMEYGILPWHIQRQAGQLTEAFRRRDIGGVLRLSADLGHYIADAHVPLHTTSNYNGQKTNQHGIHAFWESRLPELYYEGYDLLTGPARYLEDIPETVWKAISDSHAAVDSVLAFESRLSAGFPADKKFSFEQRGASVVRTYSEEYSLQYHKMLNGQVEKRMRAAVRLTGDIWYTCWVNGGKPDLLKEKHPYEKEQMEQGDRDCSH